MGLTLTPSNQDSDTDELMEIGDALRGRPIDGRIFRVLKVRGI